MLQGTVPAVQQHRDETGRAAGGHTEVRGRVPEVRERNQRDKQPAQAEFARADAKRAAAGDLGTAAVDGQFY